MNNNKGIMALGCQHAATELWLGLNPTKACRSPSFINID
jgi:hypothetical protein